VIDPKELQEAALLIGKYVDMAVRATRYRSSGPEIEEATFSGVLTAITDGAVYIATDYGLTSIGLDSVVSIVEDRAMNEATGGLEGH
jgi:predicted ATPase